MADTQGQVPATNIDQSTRTLVLIIYGLFLAAVPLSAGLIAVIGVIIAYVKRDEVRGTVWASHIENQITTFWTGFLLCVAGWATIWMFGLGLLFWLAGFVYFVYRSIKGLLAANDFKPYV